MDRSLKCFTNCLLCVSGELVAQDLYFSTDQGTITPNYYYRQEGVERIDLNGKIVAPGFLDLQTNGMKGVHFTHLAQNGTAEDDEHKLQEVSEMEVAHGVTGWWATVPTVDKHQWKQVRLNFSFRSWICSAALTLGEGASVDPASNSLTNLSYVQKIVPTLKPKAFVSGADLLGAHLEGPYINPSKKGAHNAAYLVEPSQMSPFELYGEDNLKDVVKLITLAPELPGAIALIGQLQEDYPHIVISLGHSSATYEEGIAALQLGARALTHVFNAMNPLHHRLPGLAGLMATGKCHYSIIPDGIHLSPSVVTLCMRADRRKCVFITDSIELAGLPDGVHPGHGQIPQQQFKQGNKVTILGTDTLIGSCCTLDECVRNAVAFTSCNLAEAVQCATENIADMMGESKRGKLEPGRRADFAVLDEEGHVLQTWIGGKQVWKGS